jgi:TetR/AcrR family transcriptional regulator
MKMKPGLAGSDARERLLDAAVQLFSEQGVSDTTVAEIAARENVTSAMVHYYFKTKDQLLDAVVVERLIGRFIVFVSAALDGPTDDPLAMARQLVARIVQASDRMPWLPPLWIREVISEGGALRGKLIRRVNLEKQERFKGAIAAGQKRGVVNPEINPQLTFMSIVGLTMLPLSMAKSWDRIPIIGKLSKQDLERHVVALLMHGLDALSGKPESMRKKHEE